MMLYKKLIYKQDGVCRYQRSLHCAVGVPSQIWNGPYSRERKARNQYLKFVTVAIHIETLQMYHASLTSVQF